MNRTARFASIAAIATIALAGCGGSEDDATAPPATGDAPAVEAETDPEPATLAGLAGVAETGEAYTINAPIEVPEDVAATMEDAGIEQETIESAHLIPVDIDNTDGTEPAGILGLILVNEAGETLEPVVLSDVLYEASEELGTEDADRYDRVWEAYEESIVEVQPTATGTDYVVAYDLPDDAQYTYAAVAGLGWSEVPVLIA